MGKRTWSWIELEELKGYLDKQLPNKEIEKLLGKSKGAVAGQIFRIRHPEYQPSRRIGRSTKGVPQTYSEINLTETWEARKVRLARERQHDKEKDNAGASLWKK